LLELAQLIVEPLDLLEQVLSSVRGTRRQELETLPEERAAAGAEEVAHLQVVEAYLARVA
jgi:hypothetical protein